MSTKANSETESKDIEIRSTTEARSRHTDANSELVCFLQTLPRDDTMGAFQSLKTPSDVFIIIEALDI
jgi:hypothetical protein